MHVVVGHMKFQVYILGLQQYSIVQEFCWPLRVGVATALNTGVSSIHHALKMLVIASCSMDCIK